MIGTKKLGTIRQEIIHSLSTPKLDPIECLERKISSHKRKGEQTEVMEGLKRFLEVAPKRKPPKQRLEAKKG